MSAWYQDDTVTVHAGDCLDVLRTLPDASVDAVVCDPPYGLSEHKRKDIEATLMAWLTGRRDVVPSGPGGFMGRAWDRFVPPPAVWDECFRVLKPGGHLLAFAGSRTFDLMAMSIRLAGLHGDVSPEVRDSIAWLYGSGFPKSLDVSKAIDKAAGAEREVVGRYQSPEGTTGANSRDDDYGFGVGDMTKRLITAPATDAARTWQGWGTALKPAFEPIVVARKPLRGTVASNVLAHGTGALNIDATRITSTPTAKLGAWEQGANLCDSCAARAVPNGKPGAPARRVSTATKPAAPTLSARAELSPVGTSKTDTGCSDGTRAGATSTSSSTVPSGSSTTDPSRPDSSFTTSTTTHSTTASRTCNSCHAPITTPTTTRGSSAGRWPSNVVLDESQAEALDAMSGETDGKVGMTQHSGANDIYSPFPRTGQSLVNDGLADFGGASRFFYTAKAGADERVRLDGIAHPTVKPLALMRWLVRLVCPPGGTILEPFAGSGTTVEACILEGFRCIAIEREPDYLPLIRQRIDRRRDPVAAVRAQGEDGGLFDLLDGGAA